MYAKNGDRRVPAGMTIPENYGGNAFAPRAAEAPPQPPAPPSESGCECRREPPAPPCNDKEKKCSNEPPRCCECGDTPQEAPCTPTRPEPCGDRPSPPHGGFMNISIGTEELLLIGIMALIFFSGDDRDNELLICLLLVLLI